MTPGCLASIASMAGRISSRANCAAVAAIWRCSAFRSSGVKTSAGVRVSIRKLPPWAAIDRNSSRRHQAISRQANIRLTAAQSAGEHRRLTRLGRLVEIRGLTVKTRVHRDLAGETPSGAWDFRTAAPPPDVRSTKFHLPASMHCRMNHSKGSPNRNHVSATRLQLTYPASGRLCSVRPHFFRVWLSAASLRAGAFLAFAPDQGPQALPENAVRRPDLQRPLPLEPVRPRAAASLTSRS